MFQPKEHRNMGSSVILCGVNIDNQQPLCEVNFEVPDPQLKELVRDVKASEDHPLNYIAGREVRDLSCLQIEIFRSLSFGPKSIRALYSGFDIRTDKMKDQMNNALKDLMKKGYIELRPDKNCKRWFLKDAPTREEEDKDKLLAFLEEKGEQTLYALISELHYSADKIKGICKALVEAGLIKEEKRGNGIFWTVKKQGETNEQADKGKKHRWTRWIFNGPSALEIQENVLSYLREGAKSINELSSLCNVTRTRIIRACENLQKDGLIQRENDGHNAKWCLIK